MVMSCEFCRFFHEDFFAVECDMQDRLSNDQYDDFCDYQKVNNCPFMADKEDKYNEYTQQHKD